MRVNIVKQSLMRRVERRRQAKQLAQKAFDKGVTPEQLRGVFESIDADQGNTLDRAGICRVLEGIGLAQAEVRAVWDTIQKPSLAQFGELMGVVPPRRVSMKNLNVDDRVEHKQRGPGVVVEVGLQSTTTGKDKPFKVQFDNGEVCCRGTCSVVRFIEPCRAHL